MDIIADNITYRANASLNTLVKDPNEMEPHVVDNRVLNTNHPPFHGNMSINKILRVANK